MGILINDTDFTGKWAISQNNYSSLDEYIARYERKYLQELLGVELFKLFEADLVSQVPQTQIYLDIYNPIEEDFNNKIYRSGGMKEMLLGFIYFEYIRDQKYYQTISGNVVHANEVSRESSADEFYIYGRYNEAVIDYDVIRWYINEHISDYPNFNGMAIQSAHWAL